MGRSRALRAAGTSLLAVAWALGLAAPAGAAFPQPGAEVRPPTAGEPEPLVSVFGGAQVSALAGDACTLDLDVVACTTPLFAGFHAGSRWRVLPQLGLGLMGSVGFEPGSAASQSSAGGSVETTQRLWRVGGELRLHPWPELSPVVWFGVEGGLAALETDVIVTGSLTPPAGAASGVQTVGVLGTGAGADFPLGAGLSLGVEVRVARAWLEDELRQGRTAYEAAPWLTLGASLTLAL